MSDGPNILHRHLNCVPAAAYPAFTLVKINSDLTCTATSASQVADGVTMADCDPADADVYKRRVTVVPLADCGCFKGISAGAVTAGATAYGAASGKVDDASATGNIIYGKFLTGATGSGQEVEVLRVITPTAAS